MGDPQFSAPQNFWGIVAAGVPFAASLLGILVTHEMGHFVAAKIHRVDASWPYFIPLPLGVGTLGAVIRMQGRMPSRNVLVDIGAAGPLAGAVVAIPLLIYGISLSRILLVPVEPNYLFGNQSMLSLLISLIRDTPLPQGLQMEPQPFLYVLIKKFVFGISATQDVNVHPIAYASVIGLYVTGLNLTPIGQLDGGHVAFACLGKNAVRVGKAFSWVLLLMAFFSSFAWIVWYLLVRAMMGFSHPPVEREDEPLSFSRKVVVLLSLLLFGLTLTPVSADSISLGEAPAGASILVPISETSPRSTP